MPGQRKKPRREAATAEKRETADLQAAERRGAAAPAKRREQATLAPERRVFELQECGIELRDLQGDGYLRDENGQVPTFVGYAAVWNSLSVDLGGFREIVRDVAFDESLADSADVRFLINHDSNLVLGRTRSGTCTLSKDDRGLRVECPLPDTSYARDLQVSMSRGDVDQMSFGFRAQDDSWEATDEKTGLPIRDLLSASLFDVSVVTFPAYPETSAEVRDAAAAAAVALAAKPDEAEESERSEELEQTPALSAEAVEAFNDAYEQARAALDDRAGKALSAKNRDSIAGAVQNMGDALKALQDLLDATQDADPAETNSADSGEEAATAPAAERTARPNFVAFRKQLLAESRDWHYDDDWEVYLLTQMIALASSFMVSEEDEDDVAAMETIVTAATALLQKELSEASLPNAEDGEREDEQADAETRDELAMKRRRLELHARELA